MPPATDVRLVVGFDGSPPATRALDAAVNLLRGRAGGIEVTYVAHMPHGRYRREPWANWADFESNQRAAPSLELGGREGALVLERRQGPIVEELLAAAEHRRRPSDATTAIVGEFVPRCHRVVGSVAVGLARHSPVPVVIVP
jgi:nucleotide-binding universal stress UspA family protein